MLQQIDTDPMEEVDPVRTELFQVAQQAIDKLTQRRRLLIDCRHHSQVLIVQQALRQLLASEEMASGIVTRSNASDIRLSAISVGPPGPPWLVMVGDRADLDEAALGFGADLLQHSSGRKPDKRSAIRVGAKGGADAQCASCPLAAPANGARGIYRARLRLGLRRDR